MIYRRIDDAFLDPVVFRPDSMLGVPGLMAAARAGNVTIANAVGNGVADDKAVYAFVPDLIRYYLGEEPILPNVDTYLLWDEDQRAARARPARRARGEAGGRARAATGCSSGRRRPTTRSSQFRQHIEDDPRGYIAQEVVPLSRHPTLVDDHLEGRHVDLRPFVLSGRAHRGDPRRAHPRRAAQGLARRELLPGRRLEGHLGAGAGEGD